MYWPENKHLTCMLINH